MTEKKVKKNEVKKNNSNRIGYAINILLILGTLIFSSFSFWFVLHQDIFFHTDIARDFLLLEDIVTTHSPTLLGPRSGGISGVFHGPLWFYVNLPAFIIANGDPVIVGWFWVSLIFILTYITFYVGKSLFNQRVGLLSSLLISGLSITMASSLFNPFGAVMVFPLFFLIFYSYLQNQNFIKLFFSYLLLGLLIQFQIAFGGPLLVLATILVVIKIIKTKRYKELLALSGIILPLSTYIVFELRNNFLQTNALISHITKSAGEKLTMQEFIVNRFDGIISTFSMVPYPSTLLILCILSIFAWLLIQTIRKRTEYKRLYMLIFYFIAGFWILTSFFKGTVWGYYYWPFLPMIVIIFCSSLLSLKKYIFYPLFIYLLISIMTYTYSVMQSYDNFIGKNSGSWLFNKSLAETIYKQGDKEFGYYIFSPDAYGYSPRYAMNFVGKEHSQIKVLPYKKSEVTYLIIAPGDEENYYAQGDWWRKNRVRIDGKPEKTWTFPNHFRIEKYILNDKQRTIQSDPNIIDSLLFR